MLFLNPTTLTCLSAGSTILLVHMADGEPKFSDVFASISTDCQELMKEATHYSTKTGVEREAFLENVFKYQGMTQEQFDKATRELLQRGLLRRGQLQHDDGSGEAHFVENPDGDRFALSRDVKTAIFTKILHLNINLDNPDF